MNTQELRESDAWIAVTIFSYVKTTVKLHPTDNRAIAGALYSPGCNGDLGQCSVVPHYTTNPADSDALEDAILKEMGRISRALLVWNFGGKIRMQAGDTGIYAMHEDKKVCRVLFAKKLFSHANKT